MIHFILNDTAIQTPLPPGTTVLDFVRYHKLLTGTKIGCREGDCGACTVLVGQLRKGKLEYRTMTSCLMPLVNVHGKHIVTIEGLNMPELSPVQRAFVEEGASQCGFCTPGFIVSLTGYVLQQQSTDFRNLKDFGNLNSTISAIDGNICRCTGYKSIERAAAKIAELVEGKPKENDLQWLVDNGFLPTYFTKIKERLEALHEEMKPYQTAGSHPVLIGGGTDLYVQKPEEMAEAEMEPLLLRDDLRYIYKENEICHIGASSTAADIQFSPIMRSLFPEIDRWFKLISSTQIRNMGTLGGNIVNASPIGDLSIFFLSLDSSITLNKLGKSRTLQLKNFFKGYKTIDIEEDEILECLSFNVPSGAYHFNFEKVSKRTHLDISSVNSACFIQMENGRIKTAHISMGGVSPIPLYLEKTSKALIGKMVREETATEVSPVLLSEISPISDIRGSADYKRLLARQLLLAHFLKFGME